MILYQLHEVVSARIEDLRSWRADLENGKAPAHNCPDVEIGVDTFNAIAKQRRIQGVNFSSTNAKRDLPMYSELYSQGRMNLGDLVSRRISLREVNEGHTALKDGSLTRVVFTSF
jgi:Zn-dependent alcohol dehydrogenase